MSVIRVGAVGYLNTGPLVRGLDRHPERFALRFEVPSRCAALLHENAVDVGLIPSIEYLARPDYRVVSDIGIISSGPVDSVALFTTRPVGAIKSIALDSSSRTSVALLRVLCAHWFGIEPSFTTMAPDLPAMLQRCDAALLIGDVALFIDPEQAGVDKIDLGGEWTSMTGFPFVWAFWAGRPGAVDDAAAALLRAARDEGVRESDAVARDYCAPDERKVSIATRYLRENIKYRLGDRESAGLEKFYALASDLRLAPLPRSVEFY
jgi:predicted solute-binding protein